MPVRRAGLGCNQTVYVAREDGAACRFICWRGVLRWRHTGEGYGLKEQTAIEV